MDSKPYELGMNCADETAGQVANYLLADVRIYWSGDSSAKQIDKISDGIMASLRESALAALAQRDAEVARLRAEVVRLRTSLNHIAWPSEYGQGASPPPPDWCRHLAQDTLAIGVPAANARAAALAEAPRHE